MPEMVSYPIGRHNQKGRGNASPTTEWKLTARGVAAHAPRLTRGVGDGRAAVGGRCALVVADAWGGYACVARCRFSRHLPRRLPGEELRLTP